MTMHDKLKRFPKLLSTVFLHVLAADTMFSNCKNVVHFGKILGLDFPNHSWIRPTSVALTSKLLARIVSRINFCGCNISPHFIHNIHACTVIRIQRKFMISGLKYISFSKVLNHFYQTLPLLGQLD